MEQIRSALSASGGVALVASAAEALRVLRTAPLFLGRAHLKFLRKPRHGWLSRLSSLLGSLIRIFGYPKRDHNLDNHQHLKTPQTIQKVPGLHSKPYTLNPKP